MVYSNGTAALNNVSLQIDDGEFVFIVGHSGACKTTLTRLLICEEKVSSGKLEVNGFKLEKIRSWRIPKLRRTMGVVFQDFKLFDKMTVYENVAFAMRVVGAKPKLIKKRVPYVDTTNQRRTEIPFAVGLRKILQASRRHFTFRI